MKHVDAAGNDLDPQPEDWKTGFDDSSSSGLTCNICHALVARMPEHTAGHREWHSRHGS